MEVNVKPTSKNFSQLHDYLILIFLFFMIMSVNSGYYHIQNFKLNLNDPSKTFIGLINSVRYIMPFIIFVYAIFKIVYDKRTLDTFTIAFIIYSIFQLIVLSIYPRDKNIIEINSPQIIDSIHLLISCVTMFLLISIIRNKSKILKIFILGVLLLFCIIWIYFFLKIFYEVTFVDIRDSYFYFTDALRPGEMFLEQANPRITGLSRIAGLIFIFSFVVINFKKKFDLFYYFSSIMCFFTSLSIYASQTRGGLLIIMLMLIVYIIFLKKEIIKKISFIIVYILIPILVYENIYRPFIINKSIISEDGEIINKDNNSLKLDDEKYNSRLKKLKKKDIQTYTSGRTEIWRKSINIIVTKKYIFGFGPQADRYLLAKYAKNDLEAAWGNNSSNGLVYCVMTAGIVGLLFFIFIFYKILSLIYMYYFKFNIFKKNDYFKVICFIYLAVMLSRIGFENGFFVFGIDFIIMVSTYYFLFFTKNLKKSSFNNLK